MSTEGYGLGIMGTWLGHSGFYFDNQAQFSWSDGDLSDSPVGSLVEGNRGFGSSLNTEVGKRIFMNIRWAAHPLARSLKVQAMQRSLTAPCRRWYGRRAVRLLYRMLYDPPRS
ncbi:autotransporter outer membrane beta-barrel domain-containing protein [Parasedimentitalea maritima]